MTDLTQFLTWLAVSGGAVVSATWLLNQLAWFKAREASAQSWILLGAAVGLALIAKAVLVFVPAETLAEIQPWFETVASIVAVFLTSRGVNALLVWHRSTLIPKG